MERSLNRNLLRILITMSIEEALKLVDDSKKFLEPYQIYGKMITEGITQLEKLDKLIMDKAIEEAYKLCCSMCEQIAGYRNFVPQLTDNLEKIREILKLNL